MASRRYRSNAQWQSLIDQPAQSGIRVAEFCKQPGLVAKYFYRKRRQLRDGKALVPSGSSFLQVTPGPTPALPSENGLLLHYRDSRLQLPTTTDPAWLARLLQSL